MVIISNKIRKKEILLKISQLPNISEITHFLSNQIKVIGVYNNPIYQTEKEEMEDAPNLFLLGRKQDLRRKSRGDRGSRMPVIKDSTGHKRVKKRSMIVRRHTQTI